MKYKHKSWGYCSECGFGSCKHLDKNSNKFWSKKIKKLNKAFLILFFILLFSGVSFADNITFWLKGNTLYWLDTENRKPEPENFLKFQLDHKDPPTINQEVITSIKVTKKEVFVIAGNKCWILNYNQDGRGLDWYVEDWFEL